MKAFTSLEQCETLRNRLRALLDDQAYEIKISTDMTTAQYKLLRQSTQGVKNIWIISKTTANLPVFEHLAESRIQDTENLTSCAPVYIYDVLVMRDGACRGLCLREPDSFLKTWINDWGSLCVLCASKSGGTRLACPGCAHKCCLRCINGLFLNSILNDDPVYSSKCPVCARDMICVGLGGTIELNARLECARKELTAYRAMCDIEGFVDRIHKEGYCSVDVHGLARHKLHERKTSLLNLATTMLLSEC